MSRTIALGEKARWSSWSPTAPASCIQACNVTRANLRIWIAPNERRDSSLSILRQLGEFRDQLAKRGLAPQVYREAEPARSISIPMRMC